MKRIDVGIALLVVAGLVLFMVGGVTGVAIERHAQECDKCIKGTTLSKQYIHGCPKSGCPINHGKCNHPCCEGGGVEGL